MKQPGRKQKKPPRKGSAARILLGFLCGLIGGGTMLVIAAAGLLAYCNTAPENQFLATGSPEAGISDGGDRTVLVEVREGESAYAMGRRLEQAGLIRTRHFWNLLARFDRRFIRAGTYRIGLPASQTEIRDMLITGREVLVRVTIPEGVTLTKAARILEEAGICSAGEFLETAAARTLLDAYRIPGPTMEGYLYPETYFFPQPYQAEKALRAMADTFFDRIREIAPESAELDPAALNRIVILASIVEREYRVPGEAAVMAGVFYNRINIAMPLQSCATVEYIITEILHKPHPRVLYNADIEINNSYNTYIIPGLPPGPISLPGYTALDAAFHPADSNYLYFRLVDEASGRHYFSRTFDDHIRAGQLFVKGNS